MKRKRESKKSETKTEKKVEKKEKKEKKEKSKVGATIKEEPEADAVKGWQIEKHFNHVLPFYGRQKNWPTQWIKEADEWLSGLKFSSDKGDNNYNVTGQITSSSHPTFYKILNLGKEDKKRGVRSTSSWKMDVEYHSDLKSVKWKLVITYLKLDSSGKIIEPDFAYRKTISEMDEITDSLYKSFKFDHLPYTIWLSLFSKIKQVVDNYLSTRLWTERNKIRRNDDDDYKIYWYVKPGHWHPSMKNFLNEVDDEVGGEEKENKKLETSKLEIDKLEKIKKDGVWIQLNLPRRDWIKTSLEKYHFSREIKKTIVLHTFRTLYLQCFNSAVPDDLLLSLASESSLLEFSDTRRDKIYESSKSYGNKHENKNKYDGKSTIWRNRNCYSNDGGNYFFDFSITKDDVMTGEFSSNLCLDKDDQKSEYKNGRLNWIWLRLEDVYRNSENFSHYVSAKFVETVAWLMLTTRELEPILINKADPSVNMVRDEETLNLSTTLGKLTSSLSTSRNLLTQLLGKDLASIIIDYSRPGAEIIFETIRF
jgi:hypothetical protein